MEILIYHWSQGVPIPPQHETRTEWTHGLLKIDKKYQRRFPVARSPLWHLYTITTMKPFFLMVKMYNITFDCRKQTYIYVKRCRYNV